MNDFNQEYSVFQKALNIEDPWYVIDYELNTKDLILDIYLDFKRGAKFTCSHCGHSQAKVHDILDDDRSWRHLNFWQYKTILHARFLERSAIHVIRFERLISIGHAPVRGLHGISNQKSCN
ncbi:transposase family protein [Bacillus sp. N9]